VIAPIDDLEKVANTKMPYGKYEGYYLVNLPEFYLVWYRQKGFPNGKLGTYMQFVLELKMNGLEYLLLNLIQK
jgi:uncharacterized protein (DUF3820 family)